MNIRENQWQRITPENPPQFPCWLWAGLYARGNGEDGGGRKEAGAQDSRLTRLLIPT